MSTTYYWVVWGAGRNIIGWCGGQGETLLGGVGGQGETLLGGMGGRERHYWVVWGAGRDIICLRDEVRVCSADYHLKYSGLIGEKKNLDQINIIRWESQITKCKLPCPFLTTGDMYMSAAIL